MCAGIGASDVVAHEGSDKHSANQLHDVSEALVRMNTKDEPARREGPWKLLLTPFCGCVCEDGDCGVMC
jgi:H2-forming N5,N10-methylenetetrahydromethanopterin dehydrogenase-like enzyme